MIRVYVQGVGLCGPGLEGWATSRPMLAGDVAYEPRPASIPATALLPANERRRTVRTVKLALAVGAEAFEHAGIAPGTAATVFTSSGGDGDTLHDILKGLSLPEREISPTRFHNSVHNAPAGYWSIATQSREGSSSLCAHDASFGAGLLDAAAQAAVDEQTVGLVAYDLPYPEPLHRARPIGAVFAVALVLTPSPSALTLAALDIRVVRALGRTTRLPEPLDALRVGTPAARSLPLLAALARGAAASITLDYLKECDIAVAVAPLSRGIAAVARQDAPVLAPP